VSTEVDLYCFAYAGSSAGFYTAWRGRLGLNVNVVPVDLPGRGALSGMDYATEYGELVSQLASLLEPQTGRKFALFGHSLGAMVARGVAGILQQVHHTPPLALFASGCTAPARFRHLLHAVVPDASDETLIEYLRRVGGTPPALLRNRALLQSFLPMIRADFKVALSFEQSDAPPLTCPIHFLYGEQDTITDRTLDAAAWAAETSASFTGHAIPGGHFFIHDHRQAVLQVLDDLLGDHVLAA